MRAFCSFTLLSVALAAGVGAQSSSLQTSRLEWDKEVLRAVGAVPIQEGGRLKPLETYANVQLLKLNGMRRCTTPDKQNLSAMEWFLDTLFHPELAKTYQCFLVESLDVSSMLGIGAEHERARYSYAQLFPARQTLFQLAGQFAGIPEQQRSPAQRQIINLSHNVHAFEQTFRYFEFARESFDITGSEYLSQLFEGEKSVHLSDVLKAAPTLIGEVERIGAAHGEDGRAASADLVAVTNLIREVDAVAARAQELALFPPAAPAEREWLPMGRLLERAFTPGGLKPQHIEAVAAIEVLAENGNTAAAQDFRRALVQLAQERNEYSGIPLEIFLLRLKPFYYALILFILSFLLVAISWARPANRWIGRVCVAAVAVPTALLVLGIVLRCIIRSRPPVTTLYETILFITAVAVVTALCIEWINRQRIAISLASVLGVIGVFLANKYELVERGDTMPSMIAVLDTNFWLSSHVTTVTMGYAAGLLASAIAHVYIIGWAVGIKKDDVRFYRMLARMTYGVLCFGLLFSATGTVLGGIWANNSWGRFWGWDPKENGALMIVLWQIIILHSRLGGYIRDYGVAMGAVFGGMIVAFSWFGVNLLGVGLHSYGFTSGVARALSIFYAVECCVLFLGALAYVWRPHPLFRQNSFSEQPDTILAGEAVGPK